MGILHEGVFTFMTIPRWFLLKMRNVSNNSCWENQNTFCVQRLIFRISRCLWDMSKNMIVPERTQTIWRLRVVHWIRKPTRVQAHSRAWAPTITPPHTHMRARTHIHTDICSTYCFSTATMVLWTGLIVVIRTLRLSFGQYSLPLSYGYCSSSPACHMPHQTGEKYKSSGLSKFIYRSTLTPTLSLAPYSRKPSDGILPLMWMTKFHTHTTQHAWVKPLQYKILWNSVFSHYCLKFP